MAITNEIRKSIRQTTTVLAGTIILGKYTLLTRLELLNKEPDMSVKAEEKNCQGKVPAAINKGNGIDAGVWDELKITRTRLRARMLNKGRKIAQAIPILVCL